MDIETQNVHPTRLNENLKLLRKDGISYSLSRMMWGLSQPSQYSDTFSLAKAAKVLRRHMVDYRSTLNAGSHEWHLQDSIPSSLYMIEHGADIKSQLRFGATKKDLAMAQLFQYNCYENHKECTPTHRHSKHLKSPFPVYMGILLFAKTRKKCLVEISISFD